MKEHIEQKIKERRINEANLINQIGIGEQQITKMKASLISVRGGIIELSDLLKDLNEEEE